MNFDFTSFIDFTSLNDNDTDETIAAFCKKASDAKVAAVCVYPKFIKRVKSLTTIKIATVANFPHGLDTLSSVMETIIESMKNGAAEIDLVFPYQKYLQGEKGESLEFIQVCKNATRDKALLKVILETGAISDDKILAEMAKDVIQAGADFLKTSTGKINIGATLSAAKILLTTIKNENLNVGFKASGGIREEAEAMQYMQMAKNILSPSWVRPSHFRLGMSRLL